MIRTPHCPHNRLTDGGKVVSSTHRPHFTLQKHYYFSVSGTHFCWRPSKPQGLVRQEGLGKFKKITSPDIEPATFRFVAYCLNHYATACPGSVTAVRKAIRNLMHSMYLYSISEFLMIQTQNTLSFINFNSPPTSADPFGSIYVYEKKNKVTLTLPCSGT
jgi:hypothetical protein